MARNNSCNKCVYVDIMDDDGCVIGTAHASGAANNDKFVELMGHINELAYDNGEWWFMNPDDMEDYEDER